MIFVKKKTLEGAFSGHCETSRWFVDSSNVQVEYILGFGAAVVIVLTIIIVLILYLILQCKQKRRERQLR